MNQFVKRYYVSLLVGLAAPVLIAVLFGLGAGAVCVTGLLVGTLLGANYMATEVQHEIERVRRETDEQPFPLM